ncbi:MAG TPA: hypothetical protein VGE63_00460 [Candidatus Paceibacterota bacterium]
MAKRSPKIGVHVKSNHSPKTKKRIEAKLVMLEAKKAKRGGKK